jgi:adenylate kinase
MEHPKTYIFFGNVGAGKGTQVELLRAILESNGGEVVYISPGVEYRKMISEGTYTGSLVKEILDKGHLLPEFLTTSVYTRALIENLKPESHLIADGFPRSTVQSEVFLNSMEFYHRTGAEIVYIEVSQEEAIKRMKLRGRSDDTDEGIATRFMIYQESVLPAMRLLQERGCVVHTINGEQTVEQVHEDIKKALGV